MELYFENPSGTIHFKGSSHSLRNNAVIVKAVSGLGLPKQECKLASYVNRPGQELVSSRDLARVITLSVDVSCLHGCRAYLQRIIEGLYQPGVLTVLSGSLHRRIPCRCTEVSEPEKHGSNIVSLILQFTCDSPYFTDVHTQEAVLFKRTNLISESFQLPCVFTARVNRMLICNSGSVASEPVVTISYMKGETDISVHSEEIGIMLTNHSTGQKIRLLYDGNPGERVTLDIPGRSVLKNGAQDITSTLSSDSFLSDFCLQPGENDVEIVNFGIDKDVVVTMHYDNQYVEAVV
ncbi:MAG: phage tail family protein [Clostridia bacterium]|nr:phage tail family protein [Clostridia bacterium]